MDGVQLVSSLLNLNNNGYLLKNNPYGLNLNAIEFEQILEDKLLTKQEKKAREMEKELKEQIKKASNGSTRVTIDPEVYDKMAEDASFKEKIQETLSAYLKKSAFLPGGMEAQLAIDGEGKASYKQQFNFQPEQKDALGNMNGDIREDVFSLQERYKTNQNQYETVKNRMKGLKK